MKLLHTGIATSAVVSAIQFCVAMALPIGALQADTLTLASGSNYVAVGAGGALTVTATASNAQSFERLYAGNGYFYLGVNGSGYVATSPSTGALAADAANTAAAEQFVTSAAAGSSVNLMARSTASYVEVSGSAVVANATLANATAFLLSATPDATPQVEFDFSNPRQEIAGFGAADAFYSGWLTAHPNKEQLYALFFGPDNLGASFLRVQNIYGQQQPPPTLFDPDTQEVVAKANSYRGSPITVLMTSWSPPGALKASGQVSCVGAQTEPGCTLAKVNGSYNYAGFAQYWYDSLDAYASLGVTPNYISLQNEPDWTPSGYAGCRFDPAEETGGIYAGYKQALDATYAELSALPNPPAMVGPEVVGIGYGTIQSYLSALDAQELGELSAVAHHLYTGGDSVAPDSFDSAMFQLAAAAPSKRLFETEFDHSPDQSSALDTAWLIHNAMAVEEDSAYLYWSYFWPDTNQLVYIDNPFTPSQWLYPQGYHINDYYYALEHFSRFVQPGFQRIASPTGLADLLASAYYVEKRLRRLVVVLINTSASETLTPALALPAAWSGATEVYRSTFSGTTERFSSLGPLAANNVVTLPPQSVATIVVEGSEEARQGGHGGRSPRNGISIVLSSPALTVGQGSNASLPVTINRTGITGNVRLNVTGLPSGATATCQNPGAQDGGEVTIATSAATLSGTYTLTVQATDGTNSASSSLSLTINIVPQIASSYSWTSTALLVSPIANATHPIISVKDPTVVFYNNQWNIYATTADTSGNWNMVYLNFAGWSQAAAAKPYYMDATPGFSGYHCAPELFYFTPQKKWYLIFQSGPPQFSTTDDPTQSGSWSEPQSFFDGMPSTVSNWIDFWVICDSSNCYLFFSGDNGNFYRSQTTTQNFPNGFSTPQIIMQAANAGDLFEASCTYSLKGSNQYLTIIEAMGGPEGRRYFRAFIADRLDGDWTPLASASSWATPFIGENNVSFATGVTPWTEDFSHGEMVRTGYDETLQIDPTNLQFVYQGYDPSVQSANYSQIPWRLGIVSLRQ
jgi:O-glycosyl hydrolase